MKVIKRGSRVDLLPWHQDFPDGRMYKYLPKEGREFIQWKLGRPGPYRVCRISKDERAVSVYVYINEEEIPIRRSNLILYE